MPKKKSISEKSTIEVLEEIASKAQVEDGAEAIRRVLREIFRFGSIGSKGLAKILYLPIPTIAAIRKELEKIQLLGRSQKGAILTEKGLDFVQQQMGLSYFEDLRCNKCNGTTIQFPRDFDFLIKKMKEFTAQRPKPLTNYDQAFGRPITALRRAFLLLQNDDIEGREILLLGDDDFTSLAIALLKLNAKITVIDIDNRLLDVIKSISAANNFDIECIELDLRNPIPTNLKNKFDVIITDPPYTIPGLELFLSRGLQAIKKMQNKKIYLAYAHRSPDTLLEVQKTILNSNLAIKQLILGFNLYEGSELLGNTTFIAELVTTKKFNIFHPEQFTSELYTGELNPTHRVYRCSNNHEITIGHDLEITTIELLQEQGCPICKSKKSFTKIKTIRD